MNRTVTSQVTFAHPFQLAGITETLPPGTYVVETEEEQLQAVSFVAWRRIDTTILLPRRAGGPMIDQILTIDPEALARALALDAGSA